MRLTFKVYSETPSLACYTDVFTVSDCSCYALEADSVPLRRKHVDSALKHAEQGLLGLLLQGRMACFH